MDELYSRIGNKTIRQVAGSSCFLTGADRFDYIEGVEDVFPIEQVLQSFLCVIRT